MTRGKNNKVTSAKDTLPDIELLKQLCEIHAPSGAETPLKNFFFIISNQKRQAGSIHSKSLRAKNFRIALILKFGKPRTAIFAHMDSVGFTVRYFNQLVTIGSPDAESGARLVGQDSKGLIDCELEFDKENHAFYKFGRSIDRGTTLTYKINFRETKDFIETAYLDNRLGIYNALKSCRRIERRLDHFYLLGRTWWRHGRVFS
jgi:putative aminopeptidase FrvX